MDGIALMDVEKRNGSDQDAKTEFGYAELTTAGLCKNYEHAAGQSTWDERVGCASAIFPRIREKEYRGTVTVSSARRKSRFRAHRNVFS